MTNPARRLIWSTVLVVSVLCLGGSVTAQEAQPAAVAQLYQSLQGEWVEDCLAGAIAEDPCLGAAHGANVRAQWAAWVSAPCAESPLEPMEDSAQRARAESASAARACGEDEEAWSARLESLLAVDGALRRLDAIRLAWQVAAEVLVTFPDESVVEVDRLTSLFGVPTYCDAESLQAEGRWGRVRIEVGDHSMRFVQNPLERLLMCSEFLSIIALRVGDTGPADIFLPLRDAGLLAEPYASMSDDEWATLSSDPAWTMIVDGIPPDRVWWEMVDYPDEQILIWTRALASGFINGPVALLYGAQTLDTESAEVVSQAVLAPVDLMPFAQGPDIWNTAGGGHRIGVIPIIVEQYNEMVGTTLDTSGDDGLHALLYDAHFQEAFVTALQTGRSECCDKPTV